MLLLNPELSQSTQAIIAELNSPLKTENFSRYIEKMGLTAKDVSRLCERSPRTVRSWLTHNPPGWVYAYLNANT